jgi:hypothetical protein
VIIERVVYWREDTESWYDKETDTRIENLTISDVRPLQPNKHPFDKSFLVTYEQVQKMIADTIERRTAKTHMYFEQGPDRLITYSYHREAAQAFSHEVNSLERRVQRLERPWWKRWFRR